MGKNNLTPSQLTAFFLASMVAPALINLSALFFAAMGRGSWIGILAISVASLFLLLLFYAIIKKAGFPSVHMVWQELLGNRLGKAVCFLLSLYLLFLATIVLRSFIYAINVYYLPHTPMVIVAALLILPPIAIAYFGARSMGHASQFIYFFILIFFAFLIIAKKNYQVSSIFPLLEADPQIIVKNMLPLCFTSCTLFGCFYLFPLTTNRKRIPHSIFAYSVIGAFVLLASYCIGLAFFGDIFSKMSLPFYHIDTTHKGRILERLDILYMMIVLPLFGLYLSFWFSQLIESQRQIFPTFAEQHNGWITVIWALTVVVLSVYPSLDHGIWPIYSMSNIINLIVAGILSISYLIYILKRRRKFS